MVDFIETQFPPEISYGSSGGPGFKTYVFEGFSGIEQRQIIWSKARARYNAKHGIKTTAQMAAVRDFFYAVRGKAVGFRYKDWSDYTLVNEQIGISDGILLSYDITKVYGGDTDNPYTRRIFKPVATGFIVKVDGTPVGGYTLHTDTGKIVFGSPPSMGGVITVSGEFDIPARFDTDVMESSMEDWEIETWDSIPIVEILLEDA